MFKKMLCLRIIKVNLNLSLKRAILALFLIMPLAAMAKEVDCFDYINKAKEEYNSKNFKFTAIYTDARGTIPYLHLRMSKDKNNYSLWENLNGQIIGYSLMDKYGFDYNTNLKIEKPLSWHQTLIFDRLFAKDNNLNQYSCVLTGRARINGTINTLVRLAPNENLRYGYLLAIDDRTNLPTELTIIDPIAGPFAKISAIDYYFIEKFDFPIEEKTFYKYPLNIFKNNTTLKAWSDLKIPDMFKIIDSGKILIDSNELEYQEFSDGIISFRVYKDQASQIMFPILNSGSLNVYRKIIGKNEYTVVGQIPLKLAQSIL